MNLPIKNIPTLTVVNRTELRATSATNVSDTLVKVKYDDIVIRKIGNDNFNPRTIFEGLGELADSIEHEGQTHDITVIPQKDGTFVLFDGERRYRSIGILRARSKELKAKYDEIQVKLLKGSFTETELLLKILSTQAQEPFPALDEAKAYERLLKGVNGENPLKIAEIAKSVGKNIPYVSGRLKLLEATPEEQEKMLSGKVSPTALVQLITQEADPVKRVARIKEKNDIGKPFQVKDAKQSELSILAKEQLTILEDIQKWPALDSQVVAWAQEAAGLARKILKMS